MRNTAELAMLSRRAVIGGALAIGMLPLAAAAPAPGRRIVVRDVGLWVTELGSGGGVPTIYIHGGPGVGALEFEHYMAPHLTGQRVISVDQRGTLRSDPLAPGAKPRFADLVADYEALRRTLGIERWQVLGHSFGGPIALAYAVAYPARVTRLVLENPSCNPGASTRATLAAALPLLDARKLVAPAAEARRLSAPGPLDAHRAEQAMKAIGALGQDRQRLYNASRSTDGFFGRLEASADLPEARWEQGMRLATALFEEGAIFADRTGDFARLRCPLVIVKGATDHVTSDEELAAARAAGGTVTRVAAAGHFVHVEQPARLAAILAARA